MPIESKGDSLQAQSATVARSAQAAPADNARPSFVLPSPFSDVAAGAIPGVSIPPIVGRKTDEIQEFVVANMDEIMAFGLDLHETDDQTTVLFNPSRITAEMIDEADKAGKLLELFPLATQISYPRLRA